MSLDFDVFVVDPQPIPGAVPGFADLATVHLDPDQR
jgi:hypothetical protein